VKARVFAVAALAVVSLLALTAGAARAADECKGL